LVGLSIRRDIFNVVLSGELCLSSLVCACKEYKGVAAGPLVGLVFAATEKYIGKVLALVQSEHSNHQYAD
jgi:hypothetical protein